jgi:pimeloyl-ACP methyl ester carboxylesterase
VRRERIVAAMCATPQRVMHSAFARLLDFDDSAAARACRVPVLVIEAGAPILDRERLRAALPEALIETTPGVGHFHQLEAPERVNAILERFLAGLGGPSSRR